MKKWIFSLALVFTLTTPLVSSQNMIDQGPHPKPLKVMSDEADYVSPETVTSERLVVKGMKIDGFNKDGLLKLNKAFSLLETAVNSDEFKDRVINFKNVKGERSFASNKGLTNEQIYQLFMEGRETLQPNTPGEMNFYLKLYNRPWSRVIGYTSANINTININWKFFKNYLPYDVAANLAHEWTHKIGFDHKSAAEHDSAPYAIGYIAGDIAEKIFKQQALLH